MAIRLKSEASTPVTASPKVTVYSTAAALVGEGEEEVIEATAGATRSTATTVPEVYPEAMALPAASAMPVPEAMRSSRTVPAPEREPTVTV